MDLNLGGSTAVVVGGAKGIGRGVVELFAAEGARVAVVDIDPNVEAIAADIAREHEGDAIGVVSDIVDYDSVQEAVATVMRELGGYDHVVCAAAPAGMSMSSRYSTIV